MEQIRCPHCGKRLFDLESGNASVKIVVKCPRCRATTVVDRRGIQDNNVPVR